MSPPNEKPTGDTLIPLSHGERWFVDGFSVMPHPGGVIIRLCDMTQAQKALDALRARGLPGTWMAIFVRASALALKRYPEAHLMMAGYNKVRPLHADIGLSVAGRTSYAPVLIVPSAEERSLPEIVAFLQQEVPATREKEVRDLAGMKRLGWIIPFGPLRRFILRLLGRSMWFRRRLVGTFQVTCVPNIDIGLPLVFYSGSAVFFTRITDRVLAVGGQPVVRPTVWITLALDHKMLDGRIGAGLLDAIIRVLESDELLREAEGETGHSVALPPALPAAQKSA
jgi:pyruvate/2-oxoglutarate dehydrogenase complex dihydrolipoamide acyltransferase (E2) component